MKYRLATFEDAEAIRVIYNKEVLGSTVTFDLVPRSPEDQLAWMDEHSGAHPAVVAVDDHDVVCGFGSLSPYRPRPAYRTSVENSVYVDETVRKQGVGRGILLELVRLAQAHGFHAVFAAHRRRTRGVHQPAPGVRVRAGRRRAGGRPQVRALARRGPHAEAARSGGQRSIRPRGAVLSRT